MNLLKISNLSIHLTCILIVGLSSVANAQIKQGKFGAGGTVDRSVLPDYVANSDGLVHGGEFQDLILPLPVRQERQVPEWGTEGSRVRDTYYGIEDNEYSYWGGNPILGDDGKYHCFVARWPEDTPKGHFDWWISTVAHAIADNPLGPWTVLGEAYPELRDGGMGHNPEVRKLKDGKWALFLHGGHILKTEGSDINGKWVESGELTESKDWHPHKRYTKNPSFINPRKDGSLVFCSRLGSIGFIPDGNPETPMEGVNSGLYPTYEGGPEDPVIWKTGHQYHVMFNYWKVRLAVKLRSHDGVNWELDPGVAYTQLAEKYTDGTVVPWYKAERPKVLQDEHGRATHLSLAFIDVVKNEDLSDDNHSSKHVTFPLVVEGRTEILNKKKFTTKTKMVRVRLIAENGFNPHKDVDVDSLKFGDPKEVNYGRGMKAVSSKAAGKNLVVTFKGNGSGITEDSFTGKILGTRKDGSVYYAYPRLPGFVDDPAILAVSPLKVTKGKKGMSLEFLVKNFGLEDSRAATLTINYPDQLIEVKIPPMEPYGQKSYSVPVREKVDEKVLQGLSKEFSPKYQTIVNH